LDSLSQVFGAPVKFAGQPLGTRAVQVPGVPMFRHRNQAEPTTPAEQFLKAFGKPERLLSCDCERSDDTTLTQAFQLLTGEMLNQLLSEPDNCLGRMVAAGKSDAVIVEELYLTALCRLPSAKERTATLALIGKA